MIDRRNFVTNAASAIIASGGIPAVARSQSPIDAMSALQLAAKVLSESQQMAANRQVSSWQRSVSDKLDSIAKNTDYIINDLKALRVDFRDIVRAEFAGNWASGVESARKIIDDILSGLGKYEKIPKEDKQILFIQLNLLKFHAYALMNTSKFGFAQAPFVVSAYAVADFVSALISRPAGERAEMRSKFVAFFESCVSAGYPGNFYDAAAVAQQDIDKATSSAQYYLREGTVGCSSTYVSAYRDSYHKDIRISTSRLSANLDDASSIKSSDVVGRLAGRQNPAFGCADIIPGREDAADPRWFARSAQEIDWSPNGASTNLDRSKSELRDQIDRRVAATARLRQISSMASMIAGLLPQTSTVRKVASS